MTDWRPQNADPTTTPRSRGALRFGPMTLADIVDNAFKLVKANWRAMALVVLIVAVPGALLSIVQSLVVSDDDVMKIGRNFTQLLDQNSVSSGVGLAAVAVWAVQYGLALLLTPFVTAVVCRLSAATYLSRELSAREAVRGLLKKYPAILGASILSALVILGAVLIVAIPIIVLGTLSPIFYILAIFVIVPVLVLTVLLALAIPAIAVEEVGAVRALNRSWALVARRFWPYAGTMIVIYLVAGIAAGLVSVVLSIFVGVSAFFWTPLSFPFIALSEYASNVIFLPVVAAGLTLIYFDARIRREGFDLQMAAAQADPEPPAPTV